MQMQIDNSPDPSLLAEIETAFSVEEMPRTEELTIHPEGCGECKDLREDLEAARGEANTDAVIRLIHQDLQCLSDKALRWILPHYLRYCLSDKGQKSRMETEFLVYHLSPAGEFREEALKRLAFLREEQIECLLHFLDWCSAHPHWGEYFPEDLEKAKEFLREIFSG